MLLPSETCHVHTTVELDSSVHSIVLLYQRSLRDSKKTEQRLKPYATESHTFFVHLTEKIKLHCSSLWLEPTLNCTV